ncbi:hypothetical protein A8H31_28015 [Burkholderia thailandensis]|nr:hypothetical protein A8H31_28015 [Burkholderia thailandensis]OMS24464.1 hypothetical protein AQ737_26810 [Burkholderia pseudomallei]
MIHLLRIQRPQKVRQILRTRKHILVQHPVHECNILNPLQSRTGFLVMRPHFRHHLYHPLNAIFYFSIFDIWKNCIQVIRYGQQWIGEVFHLLRNIYKSIDLLLNFEFLCSISY